MEVFIEMHYDPSADQHKEASKKDKFLRRLFGHGHWTRVGEGKLAIML